MFPRTSWGFNIFDFRCLFASGKTAACLPLVMALGACASAPAAQPGLASTTALVEYGQAEYSAFIPETYPLRAGDVINVGVFREENLSVEEIAIGADGIVALPLAGGVTAKGLTTSELAEVIKQKLRAQYIKRPMVSVNVAEYRSHRVTVEGAVEQPGVYAFLPGDRLSSAIALSQGAERVANLREVAIFREFDGQIAVAKFDYVEVRRGTMIDPIIKPGDRVVVGTSTLSQTWQDLLTALPAFGLFANFTR